MTTAAPLQAAPAHTFTSPAQSSPAEIKSKASYPVPRGPVTAELKFYSPPADGSIPFNYVEPQPEGVEQRNFGAFDVDVTIQDVRGREDEFILDRDAFQALLNVPQSKETEFVDDESIKKNYYPEVEKLLLDNVPGSKQVILFDHTIRRSSPDASRAPVTRVHIDQTPASAKMRVYQHAPEQAEELLKGRYRIINVWRPLNGPVASFPLAYASAASVEDSDLVPIEHRYPDRTGYTAGVKHNKEQQWYYLSGMENNERLFLKCFDSDEEVGKWGRVPHTAFVDPRTAEGVPGRESIEVRALIFG